MNCGKATLEPLLNEPCDERQMNSIALFTEGMNLFTQLFTRTFVRYIVQLDHSASDTGMFFIEQARNAGQALADSSGKLIALLEGKANTLTKDSYYEILFTVQSDLLPAIRGLENLFGEELEIEGYVFSEALSTLLQVA